MRVTRGSDVGAVAVIMAMFAVIMFVCAALVVDLGSARAVRREAQNSADAAALAGAGAMYDKEGKLQPKDSIKAVKDYSASNFDTDDIDWASCTTTLPAGWTTTIGVGSDARTSGTTCIAYDNAANPQIVQVVEPLRHTGTFFGGIVGYHGSDISAVAQASIKPKSIFTCVVCVLADYSGQNGDLLVTSGGVAINGGVSVGPNGAITAGGVGFATPPDPKDIKGPVTPVPTTIPHFDDPLAGLPLPGRANFSTSTASWPALGTKAVSPPASGACTATTVYTAVTDCKTMTPGVYVVTETSKLAGNGDLTGSGVLLFFGCEDASQKWVLCSSSSVKKKGTVSDAGNGVYVLSPMATGSYAGFTVIFDPANDATYSQVGNGQSTLGGGIYGAKVTLDNKGTGAAKNCDDADLSNDKGCPMAVNGMVVVGNIAFSGQDALHVSYSGTPSTLTGPKDLRLIK
jgi:Flp pilus assembly protein TadG